MRHPCGFASSLESLGWPLNVNALLNQKELMRDHLEPYKGILRRARNDKWLTRGALWGAIHMFLCDNWSLTLTGALSGMRLCVAIQLANLKPLHRNSGWNWAIVRAKESQRFALQTTPTQAAPSVTPVPCRISGDKECRRARLML